MDFRDSKGAIVKPTGKVEQHFGDTYKTYVQQTEKFPVPHQINRPPKSFTGHDELINQILQGFGQDNNIIALRGVGGLGKTALAYKLAERMRDRYKDGQLMVDMRGTSPAPTTPAQAMSKILRYYYPAAPLPESQEELQSLYLSTLEGKCVLILLDNALDGHQVLPLFPPDSCGLIITSRYKFPLDGMFPIDLDLLKSEEAVELLLKVARPGSPRSLPQEESVWKEIARICGFLPVALKAAGSYLACTPGSSPAKYVKELQDERKRLGIIGKEGVEEDLVTKLSLSYGRLAAETARVFRLLSIFPADFYAQAEEAVCLDEGQRNLIELQRWSLVEYVGSVEEGEGRYHLHDLVRLFAIELMEKEEDDAARNDAKLRHCEHFRNVLSFAIDLYVKGNVLGGLGIFDLERMNIESAWEWAERNLSESNEAASICSSFLDWPYLLDLRLHPQDLISWMETALAAARRLNDRSMEGVHLGNLGNAYAYLGEIRKAIEHYEQALAIAREIGYRRNEGVWLGNLGIAY
jgi:tetratricopeptide (TPR) repeat protein